jgi:hypothetical protein
LGIVQGYNLETWANVKVKPALKDSTHFSFTKPYGVEVESLATCVSGVIELPLENLLFVDRVEGASKQEEYNSACGAVRRGFGAAVPASLSNEMTKKGNVGGNTKLGYVIYGDQAFGECLVQMFYHADAKKAGATPDIIKVPKKNLLRVDWVKPQPLSMGQGLGKDMPRPPSLLRDIRRKFDVCQHVTDAKLIEQCEEEERLAVSFFENACRSLHKNMRKAKLTRKGKVDGSTCANCNQASPRKPSARCLTKYCSQECQKEHWKKHKVVCKEIAAAANVAK